MILNRLNEMLTPRWLMLASYKDPDQFNCGEKRWWPGDKHRDLLSSSSWDHSALEGKQYHKSAVLWEECQDAATISSGLPLAQSCDLVGRAVPFRRSTK